MTRVAKRADRPKLEIQRIAVDAGGYDATGAYWGAGPDVFIATTNDARDEITVRARNVTEARAKALAELARSPGVPRPKEPIGGKSPHKTRYEIAWENPVSHETVAIRITHARNYLVEGTDHVEIEAIRPKRARLPITDTGYLSHFIDWQQLSAAGGPVTFVTAWLGRESGTKAWRRQEHGRAQGDLFQWADARETATGRKRSTRPASQRKAAPHAKPPRGVT